MTVRICWVPGDPPYRDAVYGLLTKTAIVLGDLDDVPKLDELLHTGAAEEVKIWGLPGNDAASRLAREARYQITRTVAFEPRDRDDTLISVVIDVLDQHPAEPVARILYAAARNAAGRTRPPDHP
jgi:hypothetical protein